MQKDMSASVDQALCEHAKQMAYTQSRFDILEGYEYIETKCVKCHKMLRLQVRKFGDQTLHVSFLSE